MTVHPEQERLIAEVLGLDPEEAAAVIGILVEREWLRHGIVATAAAIAARWGVELVAALHGMAEGRRIGAEFSDYELRVAQEEAVDDVADVWITSGCRHNPEFREQLLTTQRAEVGKELVGMDQVSRSAAYVELPAAP